MLCHLQFGIGLFRGKMAAVTDRRYSTKADWNRYYCNAHTFWSAINFSDRELMMV